MSQELGPGASELEGPRQAKGHPWLAWLVIAMVASAIAVMARLAQKPAALRQAEQEIERSGMELQGRYVVGAAKMMGGPQRQELYDSLGAMRQGPLPDRLKLVTLAGELVGPEQALQELERLESKPDGDPQTARWRRVAKLLESLYTDYQRERWQAGSLDREDRQLVRKELGWFGRLALSPAQGPRDQERKAVMQSATRTVWTILALGLAGVAACLAGLVGLVTLVVMLQLGQARRAVDDYTGRGGLYAETFAIWMCLYPALGLAMAFTPLADNLAATAAVMLLSLSALAWPVLRGVSWRQVRQDVGLTWGRNPLLEPWLGGATYAMALPLMAVGLLLVYALLQGQGVGAGGTEMPSHPIVEQAVNGSWASWLQLLFLASVAAPLVEETMFRGVLYRHLREATSRVRFAVSVLVSAVITSFVFAVVHPQGLVAVPALMSLAIAFSLAREWRGTLVPAMVAHGINNGLVMTVLYLLAQL